MNVRPAVFMTIEELENVAEHIRAGDFGIAECLREKLGTDRDHPIVGWTVFERDLLAVSWASAAHK